MGEGDTTTLTLTLDNPRVDQDIPDVGAWCLAFDRSVVRVYDSDGREILPSGLWSQFDTGSGTRTMAILGTQPLTITLTVKAVGPGDTNITGYWVPWRGIMPNVNPDHLQFPWNAAGDPFTGAAPCESDSLELDVVGVNLHAVDFDAVNHSEFHAITHDPAPAGSYGSWEWQDTNDDGDASDPVDHDYPVCYTRSGPDGDVFLKTTVQFRTTSNPGGTLGSARPARSPATPSVFLKRPIQPRSTAARA